MQIGIKTFIHKNISVHKSIAGIHYRDGKKRKGLERAIPSLRLRKQYRGGAGPSPRKAKAKLCAKAEEKAKVSCEGRKQLAKLASQ